MINFVYCFFKIEDYIKSKKIPYTFIRATSYMENYLTPGIFFQNKNEDGKYPISMYILKIIFIILNLQIFYKMLYSRTSLLRPPKGLKESGRIRENPLPLL